jgi:DNA-binding response OmpR family regulator
MPSPSPSQQGAGSTGPQAFVVDDDTTIRELLYDVLTRRGYRVTTANSGLQAIEMLKTVRAGLILVDSAMPGLSGLETVKKIRTFDQTVPVVLLRGAGEAEAPVGELGRLGIVEVLRKELGVELFLKGLEFALKRVEQAPADQAGGAMRVPGTLLVVDDDEKIQRLLQRFFESRGLRVLVAGSGEEAIQALAKKPMAVLLDVNMPGMDGLMTLSKLREAAPKLPVIMASGVGEEATVRQAIDTGAYDYVTKPFNLEYLETVVLTKVLLGMEE